MRTGGPDSRATWREVGALWPQKNGHGWLLIIHPQICISGRIVITERKEKPAEAQSSSESQE
jgi:hypothetical protein